MEYAEFVKHAQKQVHAKLPTYVGAIRSSLTADDDPTGISALADAGTLMASQGIIAPNQVDQLNNLHVAVFKSKSISNYVSNASKTIVENHPEVLGTFTMLAATPEAVSDDDFKSAMNVLLANQETTFGFMRAAFGDSGVRGALNLPQDFDVEQKISDFHDRISRANSWSDLIATDGTPLIDTSSFACGPEFCVAGIALWAAVIVVQTIAIVQAWIGLFVTWAGCVFATTWVSTSGALERMGPEPDFMIQDGPVKVGVVNNCTHSIWIVATGTHGRRRVALQPGMSSFSMGITTVEAVLVGGRGNHLTSEMVKFTSSDTMGAYLLQVTEAPQILTLRDNEERIIEWEHVIAARAEDESISWIPRICNASEGLKGGSEMQETETYVPPSFRTVAVALPEGYDFEHLARVGLLRDRYYTSLRASRLIEHFHGVGA